MKLKDYLGKNNLTQESFSKKVGVHRMSLAKYLANPNQTPYVVKLAIEYVTAGEVRREDWDEN